VVQTVTGAVAAAELGLTLPHEHVIHDIARHSGNPDNVFDDVELMAAELRRFRAAGGGTVCDVTPLGLGRDAAALREVSVRSGVRIVAGVGFYQTDVWPDGAAALSTDALADLIVREVEAGAGLIGELGSHNAATPDWRRYALTDQELHLFQAAALAQQRTGLAISTHASLGRGGVAQLRALTAAGADPQRVVIGHCDAHTHADAARDMAYYRALLKEGAALEFDLFGWEELASDADRVERVALLAREGAADRVLLSTDTCRKSQLHNHGGRGFDYLPTAILPQLRQAGVSQEHIRQMTVANPARLLA